jgi:hypothetical protein
LEDLEGVCADRQGDVFAITSHSRNERGKRNANREQLIRFRLQGERVVDVRRVLNLRKRITKQHRFLKSAAKERAVKEDGGLNIEAIASMPKSRGCCWVCATLSWRKTPLS